jgi:hypothetical protein
MLHLVAQMTGKVCWRNASFVTYRSSYIRKNIICLTMNCCSTGTSSHNSGMEGEIVGSRLTGCVDKKIICLSLKSYIYKMKKEKADQLLMICPC